MKEQLKTLKDIKFVNFGPEDNWISQKQIRKAAIKWIKLFNNLKPSDVVNLAYNFNIRNPEGIANWIKHFFNIKESKKK